MTHPVDQRNRFDETVFTYRANKDGKVFISYQGKQVTILKGKPAEKFLKKINEANHLDEQLIMAKATGNFKRGNEKMSKS